jgi:hypothetical protein
MKTPFKNPLNSFAPVILMLIAMLLLGFGCNTSKPTPDPLAGFHVAVFFTPDSNKSITDDYKNYIQTLPAGQKGFIGTTDFYEDGNGQHAVSIQIFEGNKNASWQHVLFYNKDDKRIKTIRYGYVKYQS